MWRQQPFYVLVLAWVCVGEVCDEDDSSSQCVARPAHGVAYMQTQKRPVILASSTGTACHCDPLLSELKSELHSEEKAPYDFDQKQCQDICFDSGCPCQTEWPVRCLMRSCNGCEQCASVPPPATPKPTPPYVVPTEPPSPVPTPVYTQAPTPEPTEAATPVYTRAPTPEPTEAATPVYTQAPTPEPTEAATPVYTQAPTPEPTEAATPVYTEAPTPEPTLENPDRETLPPPEPTQPAICAVFAKSHIISFNAGTPQQLWSLGDYWVAKSGPYSIQARFRKSRFSTPVLRGLAIKYVDDEENDVVLAVKHNGIEEKVRTTWNGVRIVRELGAKFGVDEQALIEYEAVQNKNKNQGQPGNIGNDQPRLFISLRGLDIRITVWTHWMDVVLLVNENEGKGGICENSGSNPADHKVEAGKSLFSKAVGDYKYIGCFSDDPMDPDFDISGGKGLSVEACAEKCSGHVYFALQEGASGKCRCSDSGRKHNKLPGTCFCNDFSQDVQAREDRNCAYSLEPAGENLEESIACSFGSDQDGQDSAEETCREELANTVAAVPDSTLVSTCLNDGCKVRGEGPSQIMRMAKMHSEAAARRAEAKKELAPWSQCMESGVELPRASHELIPAVDLTPYDATVCNNDCSESSSFYAKTAAHCASVCYAVAYCRSWTRMESENQGAPNCWLFADRIKARQEHADNLWSSGTTRCHPTDRCSDWPSAKMLLRADTNPTSSQCSTYKKIAEGNLCGENGNWRKNKYCQFTCAKMGLPYEGDTCASYA